MDFINDPDPLLLLLVSVIVGPIIVYYVTKGRGSIIINPGKSLGCVGRVTLLILFLLLGAIAMGITLGVSKFGIEFLYFWEWTN